MSSLSWLIPLAPLLQNHDRDQPVGLIPIFLASVIGWHERYGVGKLVDRHRLDGAKNLILNFPETSRNVPNSGNPGPESPGLPIRGPVSGRKRDRAGRALMGLLASLAVIVVALGG